ncbi:hypothetical protein BDZ45DRAFT_743196 [Acephala macrosclerotiorum]|nr:hypothetical protein BDZ45DRAFT_743196 [Acephala macrosclerotiorum]
MFKLLYERSRHSTQWEYVYKDVTPTSRIEICNSSTPIIVPIMSSFPSKILLASLLTFILQVIASPVPLGSQARIIATLLAPKVVYAGNLSKPISELQQPGAQVGPPGTVPIPQYAISDQSVADIGGSAIYGLFKAFVNNDGDFSLLQTAVTKSGTNSGQTLEAGWINYPDQVSTPYFFTYYITDGYASQGDNVRGWIKMSTDGCSTILRSSLAPSSPPTASTAVINTKWKSSTFSTKETGDFGFSIDGLVITPLHCSQTAFLASLLQRDPMSFSTMGSGEFAREFTGLHFWFWRFGFHYIYLSSPGAGGVVVG